MKIVLEFTFLPSLFTNNKNGTSTTFHIYNVQGGLLMLSKP